MSANTWDDFADGWDNNSDVIAYSNKAYDSLLACLGSDLNKRALRILDFGCGTGLLTQKLLGDDNQIVAIDASEKMIDVLKAKGLNRVNAISALLTQTLIDQDAKSQNPLFQPKFDLIVASSVLAFVPNAGETLQLLSNLLAEGGKLAQWDWKLASDAQEDGSGFSESSLTSLYESLSLSKFEISTPFFMGEGEQKMDVIMAVGEKQSENEHNAISLLGS